VESRTDCVHEVLLPLVPRSDVKVTMPHRAEMGLQSPSIEMLPVQNAVC